MPDSSTVCLVVLFIPLLVGQRNSFGGCCLLWMFLGLLMNHEDLLHIYEV